MLEVTNADDDSQMSVLDELPVLSSTTSSHPSDVQLPKIKCKRQTGLSKTLQTIMQPKISSKMKYFSTGHGITSETAKDLSKQRSPYYYPEDLEMFAHKIRNKAWRDEKKIEELTAKCSMKQSYSGRQKKDLLPRLHVEEPPDMNMKTILDVDEEYYKVIEGRPIPDNLNIRTYITTVRETLRTKIMIGYREDDILLIQENIAVEQQKIDRIKENLQTYIDTFEEFLYREHTSAMSLLKEADEHSLLLYDTYEEYKKLEKKYFALRSSLYNSEEKWRNCKTYQKFLFVVSPLEWRQHRVYRRASIYMTEDSSSEDENVFGTYDVTVAEQEASLTDLLRVFREETDKEDAPDVYFKEPQELLDVFRFMEMQNLNSLLHCEELATPLDVIEEGMRVSAKLFDLEIQQLQETIDKLEGGISWEEDRARYLEQLAVDLVTEEFKKIVTDEKVLSLYVFIEDVYETRIGPNDASLDMIDMMQAIEEKYRYELLQTDKVPAEQVHWLEGSCYGEQMRIMKLAEVAVRQHTEMESAIQSLNRAFAPAFKKPEHKELKQRSPIWSKKREPPPTLRPLTELETDYLEFFTDFCQFTDDPFDYGVNLRTEASIVTFTGDKKREEIVEEEDESSERSEGYRCRVVGYEKMLG